MAMKFEYAPGATPIDLEEAAGLMPAHLTLQRELNEYEEANILEATEWLFARRRGDPLDERFIHIVHRRMFNQTWKWAGRPRRSDKNIGVTWIEIPASLRQMLVTFALKSSIELMNRLKSLSATTTAS
jgi:fido (protein-threonine AMPylation protein)